MKSNLEKKIESLRSCMEIAKYLDDNPSHAIQVPKAASKGEKEDTLDEHRKWRTYVSHILNSIVFEIVIKALWELDNGGECRFTHDIACLYSELSKKTQEDLRKIYDDKVSDLASIEGTDQQGKRVRIGGLVQFQTLQEALEANEETIKNFKYDPTFKGNSSAMGNVIWDDKLFWVLPAQTRQRLPEALFQYVNGRVRKSSQGDSSS
ncbi:MAG: hypothetical protein F4X83_03795 [Chloroflexi bacterium]|nr:hypothetical protein [Chloroflexota bacterium]